MNPRSKQTNKQTQQRVVPYLLGNSNHFWPGRVCWLLLLVPTTPFCSSTLPQQSAAGVFSFVFCLCLCGVRDLRPCAANHLCAPPPFRSTPLAFAVLQRHAWAVLGHFCVACLLGGLSPRAGMVLFFCVCVNNGLSINAWFVAGGGTALWTDRRARSVR